MKTSKQKNVSDEKATEAKKASEPPKTESLGAKDKSLSTTKAEPLSAKGKPLSTASKMQTTEKWKEDKKEVKDKKSEKKENLVAIVVFVVVILFGIGIFTNGFGLLDKTNDNGDDIRINVPIGNDPFTGDTKAGVVIIAFSDYECPFCKRGEQTIQKVIEQYKDDVVYVFKDFPLTSIHPNAYNAALGAECAKEQDKFWEYHEQLYEHNDQLELQYLKDYARTLGLDTESFNECLESEKYKKEVDKDIQTGKLVGVTGTPTFFINGLKVVGAKQEAEFINIINSELESN